MQIPSRRIADELHSNTILFYKNKAGLLKTETKNESVNCTENMRTKQFICGKIAS